MIPMIQPSFDEERKLEAQGYRLIAGVDEAGCGALAGPVVAAAVILPPGLDCGAAWSGQVRDSKQLSPGKREALLACIKEAAVATGTGMASHEEVDAHGLTRAVRLAMKRAVAQLQPRPDSLLIDFVRLPGVRLPQRNIVNGDELCFSVACASIVAKVTRDRIMVELDRAYPGYGLARHKGYGTGEHLSCLRRLGPSPVHRRSYRPVSDICEGK